MLPVIWLVLSGFGVVGGPFGTFVAMGLAERVVFWPLLVAIAILVGAALRVITQDYLGLRRYRSEAPMIALLSTLILTPPLGMVTRHLVRAEAEAPGWLSMAAYVFLASMATSTLRHAFAQQQTRPAPTTAAPATPQAEAAAGPRLLARLDPERRGRVIRLQMSDHYVEVITTAGRTSLLMRFADAIGELEGLDGLQVHRSHWVTRAAIRGAQRSRGRITLLLRDGSLVPVSRTYQRAVEAMDLLAPCEPAAEVPAAE
ncbi:MAG: LytTR family transcriptional regulator [Sphingomonadales bacterium]|nr:LytTR family transcriptional regulator [Sphingomonadales bacterium]